MTALAAKNGGNGATFDTTALARLADEVIQQLQRGETVDSAELARRYPEHADKLCELLPAIQALADLSRSGERPVPPGEDPLADSADGQGKNRELGDFRILRQIGRGGMGIVYEAEQVSLRRRVALKILPLAGVLDQRHLARFKNESLAAAALQHPHIVPVYAVGCERGIHYYAMQYVGGQNLAELIRELRIREGLEEQPADANDETPAYVGQVSSVSDLTSEVASQNSAAESTLISRKGSSTQRSRQEQTAFYRNIARLGLQAAEALAHAHEEGVIHRDIKPSNLLLDAHGQLWITDFGLARTKSDAGVTLTGDLLGTLRYMSPEQAMAKRIPVDHRTDIYSLGATLYELLTLQPMFAGENQAELLRKITFDDPLPPRRLRSDLPLDLETILLKSVEKDPRDRYATARELADELGRYLDNAPILARRPTIRQSALRWCRRHRGVVTGLALVLVAWLVIGSGSWWWVTRERFHRQQETLAAVSKALAEAQAQKTKADAATAAEKKANEELQKRLEQIERANELVGSIFADLNPHRVLNATEPLTEILSRRLVTVAEQLDDETVGDPRGVAILRNRLGRTLVSLGHPKQAMGLLEKSHQFFKTHLGNEHPITLHSMNDVSQGYKALGNVDKALAISQEAFQGMKATLGTDHLDTIRCMHYLGACYLQAGEYGKALPLIEEALRMNRVKLGPDHPFTVGTLALLAVGYQKNRQFDKAVLLFEEIVPIQKRQLGADHALTLQSIQNLAVCYMETRRFDEGLPLFEEALRAQQLVLGCEHPDTISTMNNLAKAYSEIGQLNNALPLMAKALALAKSKLGPEHPGTLTSMSHLARGYRLARKLDLALPLLEETLQLMKTRLGPEHPDTLNCMNSLAKAYQAARKFDLALPLFEETLQLQKSKLGHEHPDTLMSMHNLGEAYQAARQLDLALPLLEETLKLRKSKLDHEHPDTLTTMNNLGAAYQAARQLDLALPLLEETLQLMKTRLGPEHPDTLITMNNLGAAYCEAGKLDLALPLMEDVVQLRKAKLGDDNLHSATSIHNLARGYQLAGKLELALPLYEETLRLRRAELGPEHPDTLKSMHNLGEAYQAARQLDLALPLLEETLKLQKSKLGHEHPDTLFTMNNLGVAYREAGKLDLALPLLEDVVQLRKATLGDDNLHSATSINNLATTYTLAGKLDKALPFFEQAALGTEKLNFLDANSTIIINNTIAAYETARQFDKAETWRRKWLAVVKEKSGAESPAYGKELAPLGQNLVNQQKWTEAEPVLRECLAIREKSKPNDWSTYNTRSTLGGALLGQKKYTEAEPLLLAGYQGMKEREKTIPPLAAPRISEALDRLIQLYTETNKPEEAKKWQAEREAITPPAPPATHEKPQP